MILSNEHASNSARCVSTIRHENTGARHAVDDARFSRHPTHSLSIRPGDRPTHTVGQLRCRRQHFPTCSPHMATAASNSHMACKHTAYWQTLKNQTQLTSCRRQVHLRACCTRLLTGLTATIPPIILLSRHPERLTGAVSANLANQGH